MAGSPIDFVAALEPFDRAESERLRRYVSYADALAECAFLSEKLHYSFQMTRGQPYEVEEREDDELVAAWLLRFRPLHLEGKATSATFNKMRGLISQHLRSGSAGQVLRNHLMVYKRARRTAWNGTGIELHLDDGQVRQGKALDDWLNGVYFHDDEDKRGRVEALRPFGFHHHLALCAGRDLSEVYLGFSTYIVRPVTEKPALCRSASN